MSFSIRINTLKTSREEFLDVLQREGIECKQVEWYDKALLIEGLPKEKFMNFSFYREGLCYIQNLSSMIPAFVLDPEPGGRVLDMCAAPGGKTIQLANEMENKGEIVANDVSRSRLFKTKALLERYGAQNVRLKQGKGERLWQREENGFDRVLVDAPCSMCQDLPQKKIKSLAKRQRALLHSAHTCTKPGGRIVYSTCTLTEEENERTVEWLLHRVENIEMYEPSLHPELKEFRISEGVLRIPGDEQFEPFFVACFRKTQ